MDTLSSTSSWAFDALQVVGTVAFAVSGAMAAMRKKMDWFGVAVLGVIVAVGGGTIRDLLLPGPRSPGSRTRGRWRWRRRRRW